MSVASAERKVARCKEQLRLAYEALQAEREKARRRPDKPGERALAAANETLERFCADYLARNPDEYGISKLPVRLRFVTCALAGGMDRKDVAELMPKVNGKRQFVRMGLSRSGLSKLVSEARWMLVRINRGSA